MTSDPRTRIECTLGLHPANGDGQTVPLADAVMEIVQPIADERDQLAAELEENTGVLKALRRQCDQAEAGRDEAVRAVQGWMALDLHMALGKLVDHSADTVHQGHGSWADWWADLCAEVRTRRRPVAMVTDHTYEGTPGPGQHCETERFGQTCNAAWEQHRLRDCPHVDTWFDRTVCPEPCGAMHDRCTTCGETVNPCTLEARTTVDNPLTSTNTVDNPKEQP